MTMEEVYRLLQVRNSHETNPFLELHEAYASLQKQVDYYQCRCEILERDNVGRDTLSEGGGGRKNSSSVSRNEAELMDKVDCLQEELNERHRINGELQNENDDLRRQNDELIMRIVSEKERMIDEVNKLNESNESLRKEVQMLRTLMAENEERHKQQQQQQQQQQQPKANAETEGAGRKWGSFGVVPPSQPKQIIQAYPSECMCVRYDFDSGGDVVATAGAGNDSTVKLWNTHNGQLKLTLRCNNHPMLGVDIRNGLVAGCSSDKTARVWSAKTGRMIHHLVGHVHKINCIRLSSDGTSTLTGSADRSIKVWDISRNTYRQTTTFRHSSTTTSIDLSDHNTVVSAHVDGGLRFWDMRSKERTADIHGLHDSGITSVQFEPTNGTHLLTNGKDHTLKIVDVRMCETVQTFSHPEFRTLFGWSGACYSPDGTYVAAGSSTPATLFVWQTADGKLVRTLDKVHKTGASVIGVAWGRGGTSGQQVASVDKAGGLVLWA